jgi:hypothetical protein
VTDPIEQLDQFLRGDFVRINTALEEVYLAERIDVMSGRPELDALKRDLLRLGGEAIERVGDLVYPERSRRVYPERSRRATPPEEPRAAYRLLGLVGHYLAACQRHEAPLSSRDGARDAAWRISSTIGATLGVAPRLVFAHQSLFNDAVAGRIRTFTSLPDEEIFIRFNALGVLAYRRAAAALRDIADLGVSSPGAAYALDQAESALRDVLTFNQELAKRLNVERFFLNIRPYFKTYRVGDTDHRGANAGDFAAINEIDVTLGLCRMDDPFYRAMVREKFPFVPPDDQPHLRTLDRRVSLLDAFIRELDSQGATDAWQANASRFLAVCTAHGAAYAFHHQRLVKPYVEAPAYRMPTTHAAGMTSSGPPLDQVMAMLGRLLDLRLARNREGLQTAAGAIARMTDLVGGPDELIPGG